MTAEEIGHWLELPRVRMWIAERDGRLGAYADVSERNERTRFWIDLRSLDADATAALLEAAEEWARAEAAPEALLFGSIAEPDRATRAVYERVGFRAVRHSFEMRIELDGEPTEPVWPDGVAIRLFEPGRDDERLHGLVTEAFADHWEATQLSFSEWRRWQLEAPDFDPALVFLVEAGEELVGTAMNVVRPLDKPIGWVESLAVRRPWRGRGLGLALLRQSFRAFSERGLAQAGLDVDAENLTGAVRLYERAGMRVAKRTVMYEKAL